MELPVESMDDAAAREAVKKIGEIPV